MNNHRYSVAVDFDGVIHRYDSPWQGPTVIPDKPVPGAVDWLHRLDQRFDIIIHTTRAATPDGAMAVADWLTAHHIPFSQVTAIKPPALIYIDDRAYRFTGANFPEAQQIHELRPWIRPRPVV